MSRNTEPIFIGEPFVGVATLFDETVVRNPGSTSGMQLLVDAGANGGLVESLWVTPLGNNAPSVLRIYYQPLDTFASLCLPEISLPLIDNASETEALSILTVQLPLVIIGDVGSRGLRLAPRSKLWAGLSTTVANGYNVFAQGGFY